MNKKTREIIGATTTVSVAGYFSIPAKIDTGADSSAIWASKIFVDEEQNLNFCLFSPASQFYDGKVIKTKTFKAVAVRSAHGDEQIRYRVILPLKIKSRTIRASFTLADRSKNDFPILIGRRTLKDKFIVDVSQTEIEMKKRQKTKKLNIELEKNPFKFHQKYLQSKQEEK